MLATSKRFFPSVDRMPNVVGRNTERRTELSPQHSHIDDESRVLEGITTQCAIYSQLNYD